MTETAAPAAIRPETHGPAPEHERDTGVELVFMFTMPALILVAGIASMAATGYWWLMGVTFVGELMVTSVVAQALIHLTDAEGEQRMRMPHLQMPRWQRPSGTSGHHRLVLHH